MRNLKQPLVISGLVKRRRDIQAKADHYQRKYAALRIDIETLDKAINVIDPDFSIAAIRPKHYTEESCTLLPYQSEVLQLLRESDTPPTVSEIINKLIEDGYPVATSRERRSFRDRVRNFLARKIKRGWVVRDGAGYKMTEEFDL